MTRPDLPTAARPARFTGWAWLTAVGVAVGLAVAPVTCNVFDVVRCSLPWAAASGGSRPWAIYAMPRSNCIYPPVIQYVLTIVRRVEIWTGLPVDGPSGVAAVKVPCLLAYAAGAWLCAAGLAPVWGRRRAAAAAAAYALCLPVWYDAAVWGQWDAILSLALLASAVAVVRDRPGWAGAAAGVAMAIKVQAVVALPPLAVYGLRRWGWRGVARGVGGAAAAWVATVAPMLIGGAAGWEAIRRPFTASVGFLSFRTVLACNVWMVGETATAAARAWTSTFGPGDAQPILGSLTAKQLGLALFAADAAVLLAGLWHRPTPRRFVLASGLLAFGLYMLATQMHERYVVTAAATLAILAGHGRDWRYYAAVSVPALANLVVALAYLNATTDQPRVTPADLAPYQPWLLAVSVANVAVLLATTAGYVADTFADAGENAGPTAAVAVF